MSPLENAGRPCGIVAQMRAGCPLLLLPFVDCVKVHNVYYVKSDGPDSGAGDAGRRPCGRARP